ncbi:hypothetical protein TNCV_606781 [Trichonephila clavipes]|nr:hypothetical protein TNCV_606781 [Trichonephila clavipes]
MKEFKFFKGLKEELRPKGRKGYDGTKWSKRRFAEVLKAFSFGRPDCKNSPQSHIVRVYDAGDDKSGVFHSAEWHDGDWSNDGIRGEWLWCFIWVESFLAWLRA